MVLPLRAKDGALMHSNVRQLARAGGALVANSGEPFSTTSMQCVDCSQLWHISNFSGLGEAGNLHQWGPRNLPYPVFHARCRPVGLADWPTRKIGEFVF